MIELRTADEIRNAEAILLAELPDGALMRRAATGLEVACARLIDSTLGVLTGSRVVLLVGSGNNGGDALWAGAGLAKRGCRVDAIAIADRVHTEGASALAGAGGRVHAWDANDARLSALIDNADLVIDGILGIGGDGALRPDAASVVDAVARSGAIVVAVDVPSGVSADTGTIAGSAVAADVTVTFGAVKPGLLVAPGVLRSGSVLLIDIDLPFAEPASLLSMESLDVADWVVEPAADAYKYRRGVVGVAAGSAAYPGAALLSTAAARRGNVGMARFLDRSDGVAALVVSQFPDIVIDGSDPQSQDRVDAWVCGPGFSGDEVDAMTVRAVLSVSRPVVFDAGALSVLANNEDVREAVRQRAEAGLATLLTPHDGEFERLFPGLLASGIGRLEAARQASAQSRAILVLKGPGTIVAAPEGISYVDTEGTSDLGTAGSGDVLSGILGAILAGAWAGERRTSDELAAATAAAVWLHGAAGRIAASGAPVVATDIADSVAEAIRLARFGPEHAS